MPSTIAAALQKQRQFALLVELDFDGWEQRFSTGPKAVPYSGGNPKFFQDRILSISDISSSLDLYSMRYSLGSISITIANKDRWQDNEVRHRMDGGTGKVYGWCKGLDWAEIEPFPLFRGTFRKQGHTKDTYTFALEERSKFQFRTLPTSLITTDTWPSHRTTGGGGSVAGKPQPLLLGDWAGGVPLLCAHTTTYDYVSCMGPTNSTAFNTLAQTTLEYVWNKNGAQVGSTIFTYTPGKIDGVGNVVGHFTFTADRSSDEPLYCSIEGLADASGNFAATAGDLLEHPADMIHFLMYNYSNLDPDEDISIETLRTMRSLLPGLKFQTIVNKTVNGADLVDRLLWQCQAARVLRWGKIGAMVFDTEGVQTARLPRFNLLGRTVSMDSTPEDRVVNNLSVLYGFNPTSKKWEGELLRNRDNRADLKKSYLQYGERPQETLQLMDVQDETWASFLANRYLKVRAFRHDLVECEVPVWEAWDILEGDTGLLTVEEGSSADGTGWTSEPCILLERSFSPSGTVRQLWWRVEAER